MEALLAEMAELRQQAAEREELHRDLIGSLQLQIEKQDFKIDRQDRYSRAMLELERTLSSFSPIGDPGLSFRFGEVKSSMIMIIQLQLQLTQDWDVQCDAAQTSKAASLSMLAKMLRVHCAQIVAFSEASKHPVQGQRYRYVELFIDTTRSGVLKEPEHVLAIGDLESLLRFDSKIREDVEKRLKQLQPEQARAGASGGGQKRPWGGFPPTKFQGGGFDSIASKPP